MSKMKYSKIPYVKNEVSKIIFGTASEPILAGENCNMFFDEVYKCGVNTFDTARGYGSSEKVIGDWIESRGKRDDLVLISKCCHPDEMWNKRVGAKFIIEDFDESINALRTDYIDVYLLHRDNLDVEVGEIVETLNGLHKQGKIGAFGGSNWTTERIQLANEYAYKHNLVPFTVTSPSFSLAEQVMDSFDGGCTTLSTNNEKDKIWYKKNAIAVLAYSSLGRGLFSGKIKSNQFKEAAKYLDEFAMRGYGYEQNFERLKRCEELAEIKECTIPQLALAWVLNQELNTFTIVSSIKYERIKSNIKALDIDLSIDEINYLNLIN